MEIILILAQKKLERCCNEISEFAKETNRFCHFVHINEYLEFFTEFLEPTQMICLKRVNSVFEEFLKECKSKRNRSKKSMFIIDGYEMKKSSIVDLIFYLIHKKTPITHILIENSENEILPIGIKAFSLDKINFDQLKNYLEFGHEIIDFSINELKFRKLFMKINLRNQKLCETLKKSILRLDTENNSYENNGCLVLIKSSKGVMFIDYLKFELFTLKGNEYDNLLKMLRIGVYYLLINYQKNIEDLNICEDFNSKCFFAVVKTLDRNFIDIPSSPGKFDSKNLMIFF
jgi:hypothetical protein